MDKPKIGFIGMGEAAYHIAKGLNKEGITSITAYDKFWNVEPQASNIQKRAKAANVALAASLEEMIKAADFIFSAVSANLALPLAKEAAPCLAKGQYYIDINAASPMTKEEANDVIGRRKAFFVDVAVMGPVPNYGHKVPILACGSGAQEFTGVFKEYGMNITYVGEKAGGASALKMFRSIFMKGFVMLLLESVLAGHAYGVEDQVLDSVIETLESEDSLRELINGLLARGVIHSGRREHEMEEVIATLLNLRIDYTMSAASKEKLKWCTGMGFKEYFQGVPPRDFHEILAAYDKLSFAQGRGEVGARG